MWKFGKTVSALALVVAVAGCQAPPVTVTAAETLREQTGYRLTWTTDRPEAPVDVYVSDRPDAAIDDMRRLVRDDTDGTASFADPLGDGTRPYFYIASSGADTGFRTATRVVPLEGASNFRDIGGYPAADGKHVKWGQVFRSNALSNLTPADYRTVSAMGVKLVCDLRTDQERTTAPTRWPGTVPTTVTSAKVSLDTDMGALFAAGVPSADQARATFIGFYRQMPEVYAPEYRDLFARLAAGQTPTLVHCSAGKDRTGLATALLLTALGVPRDIVVADFAMSDDLLAADLARPRPASARPDPTMAMFQTLPREVISVFMATDPAYIEASLDEIEADHGTIEAYLDTVLGVDAAALASLRSRLTE